MSEGILPKRVTKRNGYTKYGISFWIGKKTPTGKPYKKLACYNLYTRNLICTGKTKEEIIEKINKKYLKYIEEDR